MEKKFDAVAWMRTQRTKIDIEDQGLSWEEKRRRTRELLETDPLWLRLKHRLINPMEAPSVAIGEPKRSYDTKKSQNSGKSKRSK